MRRIFALVLAVALLLPVLATQAGAVTYAGSQQYRAGKYYSRLTAVKLTGDQRTDIVNIARSQIGYQEGNSSNQLGGEIMGSTNFTEFGYWYGAQDMWCAMFVSWCANLAGVSQSVIPSHAFTPNGLKHFRDRDQDYSPAQIQAGEYTPRAGDLIYFKNGRNANRTNHVGLVTGYSNGRIYTIEGNVGSSAYVTNDGMVAEKSYPITNEFIVAVCCPAYPVTGTAVTEADVASLREALYALESGSCYSSVSAACGILTLGAGQWYGEEARILLQSIQAADSKAFARLDDCGIAEMLTAENWATFRPTDRQTAAIGAILSSDAGIRCQDSRMDRCLKAGLKQARKLGITDDTAALLFAGVLHLNGESAANRLVSQLDEITADALTAAEPFCRALSRYL